MVYMTHVYECIRGLQKLKMPPLYSDNLCLRVFYYSLLSHTCYPSDVSMVHGHGLNKENASLNVCEEYEMLNQSMRPSAFYQSAD